MSKNNPQINTPTLLSFALVHTILFTGFCCRHLLVRREVEVKEHNKEYETVRPDDDSKKLGIRAINEKKLSTVDHAQSKLGLQTKKYYQIDNFYKI